MKLTFFSDTHNRHRKIKFSGGDVLVFCGDLTNRGELSQVEDFSKFVKKLDYQGNAHIAFRRWEGIVTSKIEVSIGKNGLYK